MDGIKSIRPQMRQSILHADGSGIDVETIRCRRNVQKGSVLGRRTAFTRFILILKYETKENGKSSLGLYAEIMDEFYKKVNHQ
jgi:hypothetical protein